MSDGPPRLADALASRYRIERELVRGGMATVYLAHDTKHGRPVALKVLRPELAATLGADRFLREIAITARLDHPHILTLIDSGEAAGFFYYVVPFVRGESLGQRLTREPRLPVEEALRITRQVAAALDHAHRHGVIHRDVKPENILLHEGEAMLTDFGIALAIQEASPSRLTESGVAVGTPRYMSPEQATVDRQIDARTDQYSLATVLYEMLTGEPPRIGATREAIIAKLVAEASSEVSEAIGAALARALRLAPNDRFPSVAEFAEAVSQGSPGGVSHRWLPRRRALAALAAAAALIAAGWGWFRLQAADHPLVVMMDSPHPDRVYDEETIRASGTNADVISDILADLPIIRQKETAGPAWHRHEEIVRFRPDLIIMHYSSFRGSDADDPRPGLKTFLRYFADGDTRFLIYTRTSEARVRYLVDSLMADVEAEHPGLLARITVFGTPDHGGAPRWRDPVTAGELKLAVKRILALQ